MVKPEKTFKMGAVRATIFRNTIERNGQTLAIPKVVIEVRYRDKAGQWQGTNSLSLVEDLVVGYGFADHSVWRINERECL